MASFSLLPALSESRLLSPYRLATCPFLTLSFLDVCLVLKASML